MCDLYTPKILKDPFLYFPLQGWDFGIPILVFSGAQQVAAQPTTLLLICSSFCRENDHSLLADCCRILDASEAGYCSRPSEYYRRKNCTQSDEQSEKKGNYSQQEHRVAFVATTCNHAAIAT